MSYIKHTSGGDRYLRLWILTLILVIIIHKNLT